MKIEIIHPQTRETILVEVDETTPKRLAELLAPRASLTQIQQQVDNLPYNQDVKALLGRMASLTLEIGGVVLQVGREFLELVFTLMRRYPNTTFYTLMGVSLGFLISSIPVLGWLLGWLIQPLFIALGLVMGLVLDFQAQRLQRQISEHINEQINEQLKRLQLASPTTLDQQGGDR